MEEVRDGQARPDEGVPSWDDDRALLANMRLCLCVCVCARKHTKNGGHTCSEKTANLHALGSLVPEGCEVVRASVISDDGGVGIVTIV
jgi:hypothetical protein